jgi:glycosyltransferase involved in cell wall biosynthesis
MIQPSVSIIIPVYNAEEYVADCLKSVMRQTYRGELECILVDDCGSDKSMEVVEKMVSEYDGPVRFKILHHEHNRGASAARNTGIENASGDYLFFLDSDDEVTDDCIEVLTRPLADGLYDVVEGGLEWFFLSTSSGRNTFDGEFVVKIPNNTLVEQPDILRTYQKGWSCMVGNKLIRTGFVKENNLFFKEGVVYEDMLWCFQTACLAKSLFLITDITYRYKLREGSVSDKINREVGIKSQETIIQEARAFVDAHHIPVDEVFTFLNARFWTILNLSSYSKKLFVSEYKEYRPCCCKPSFALLREDRKNLIRWAHYWMPAFIAPYWQWHFFKARHTFTETVPVNN